MGTVVCTIVRTDRRTETFAKIMITLEWINSLFTIQPFVSTSLSVKTAYERMNMVNEKAKSLTG